MVFAPVKDAKAAALVEEAAGLARRQKETEARLDEIKQALRDRADAVAAKRPKGERRTQVEFDSPAGVATVIFVGDVPRLARGADTDGLEARYPGLKWGDVFKKRVMLKAGWQEAVGAFPKAVQKALERLVDWEPSTPHVVLPK